MRTITRNVIIALLVVIVLLLALGALPSYLATGDPYYVEATAIDEPGPAIDADNLSERRFPYTFEALGAVEAGDDPARSEAYYTGPGSFKEAFTHTPFDEFSELNAWNSQAVAEEEHVAYVEANGTYYRLEITPASEIDADP